MIARLPFRLYQDAGGDARTVEQARDAIRAAFAEPEFQRSSWELFVSRFMNWLKSIFGGIDTTLASLGPATRVVVIIILLIVLALLLTHIFWTLGKAFQAIGRGTGRAAAEDSERGERAEDLAARAQAAFASGDYLLSMRLYFAASVVALGNRKRLFILPGFTHGEILERGGASATERERLAPLTRRLDVVWFGGENARAADAESFKNVYIQIAAERLQ
ncbi:MAG: hypothetical protein HY286_06245 [Planctomycetes bacterium]|nr:hypothetical protein [Planctomycetota bacterium]